MFEIPLGWLQLKRERLRFAVALLGVSFAVVLILMQLGFREAMFKSAVRFHDAMNGDIVLVSNELSFIVQPRSFSNRASIRRAASGCRVGHAGVPGHRARGRTPTRTASARSSWSGSIGRSCAHARGRERPARGHPARGRGDLRRALAARVRPIAERVRAGAPVTAELNNRALSVAGIFRFGTSFGIDGTVITSETNFLRLFPNRQRGLIEIGLVRVEPGESPDRVRDAIRAALPADVEVLTRAAFANKEIAYWDSSTPIGYIFSFGVLVAMVVGGIIVYQILFADVNDHLPEYATLRRWATRTAFLAGVVIQQAVILAALGFLPGVAMSIALYRVSGEATRLPLEMTLARALFVLGLTVTMCTIAALMALRKVRSADPAEVF